MKALKTIIGTLVVVSASAFSPPSEASMSYRTVINHASAVCTGTTPFNQNMLRIRAFGITNNTSSAVASVNCGGVSTPFNQAGGDVLMFETGLLNRGSVAVTVNCMVEDSADGTFSIVTQYPRTITLPAGSPGWLSWSRGSENGGKNFVFPSMSCQLPFNVEISYTALVYQVDVGL